MDQTKFTLKDHLFLDPLDHEEEYQLMYFFCTNFGKLKRLLTDLLEEIQDLPSDILRNRAAIEGGDAMISTQVRINSLYALLSKGSFPFFF